MSSSSSARISISSDEVNLLVYRYLVEAGMCLDSPGNHSPSSLGFKHSSFVFHGESLLQRSPNLLQADLPPGSLVTLLQKALLFLYVETHVSSDGKPIKCDEVFSLLKAHDHDHGALETDIAQDSLESSSKPPSKKHKLSSAHSTGYPSNTNGTSASDKSSAPISSSPEGPLREPPSDTPEESKRVMDDPMPDAPGEAKVEEASDPPEPKLEEQVQSDQSGSNLSSLEQ